ncbi:hypothetical protein [Actinomyces sp. 2119]|uniref:hypothetical protein n=1 Tax=Actinomyces sp. 2119 TaxID=2321393 RepID=UPI0021758D5A|nr:hypothetical protein [Actinomyces sp. 2119]
MTDIPGTTDTTGPTAPAGSQAGRRPQAPGAPGARRALRWGLAIMVLAACLPLAAQLTTPPASTLMWLASMPLCLAGAGVAGRGALHLAAARRAREEETQL